MLNRMLESSVVVGESSVVVGESGAHIYLLYGESGDRVFSKRFAVFPYGILHPISNLLAKSGAESGAGNRVLLSLS